MGGCAPTAGTPARPEHLPRAIRGGGEADTWPRGFLLGGQPGAGDLGILLPVLKSDLSLHPEDVCGSPSPRTTVAHNPGRGASGRGG